MLTRNQYVLHINSPVLFGKHTAGYTFEAGICQPLQKALWINWMDLAPGTDYYRCSFYGYVLILTSSPG